MNTQATDNELEPNHSPRPRFRGPRIERMAYGHTLAHELLSRADRRTAFMFERSFRAYQRTLQRYDRVSAWLFRMEQDTRENCLFLPSKN